MNISLFDPGDIPTLEYAITHVFLPLQLPDGDDHSISNDCSLIAAVASVARLFIDSDHAGGQIDITQWLSILRMLDNLQAVVQFQTLDRSQTWYQLSSMNIGDTLAFLIRAQNAAVVFRRQEDVTIFESFEVSPKTENVMNAQGKLICSYPGPAVEIPNDAFDDDIFLAELVNFLVHMNVDILDAAATSRKAQSTVIEARDTSHPRYITELLTGILRSVGRPADVVRICKRVGDDVVWKNSKLPWRRSSLWLLIRVVIQTSLDRSIAGHDTYKKFMLFFMCCLAKENMCGHLSNDFLHFMSAKIGRRLQKLGPSVPNWLSQTVLQTCTLIRLTLEKRWKSVQDSQRASPLWSPSQLDLSHDIQLSLSQSSGYIQNALSSRRDNSNSIYFSPKHRPQGTLVDFLSSDGAFFEEAYSTEPDFTLYEVEQAVERGIDAWLDRVTDNDGACVKLEILGEKYSSKAAKAYAGNPELLSVMLLTTVELWVALDKLAIREIPMLADYSPEVPASLLEVLLIRKNASLHRLRRAHQYISNRHSRSNCGSVFSSTTTKDSFAARFYRESVHLQFLKAGIEQAAQQDRDKKMAQLEKENARHADLKQKCVNTDHSSAITQEGREYHPKNCTKCKLEQKLRRLQITLHEWPLPNEELYAEIVVFELDCPISFNMWRTATFHLLVDLCSPTLNAKDPYIRLTQYDALRPYFVRHPRSRFTLGSDTKPFTVSHYNRVSLPTTEKRVCVNNGLKFSGFDAGSRNPVSEALGRVNITRYCTYELPSGPYQNLQKFVVTPCHVSNEVMANQLDCHKELSIHEYLAFGHLRSGGSLQWLNILRELRGRSLTFRRYEVHALIAQAASQVGPLVAGTEELMWHQEIRQPSFCYALIEELDGLFKDVKANWLEGVTMDTISFLLGRILVSNPDQAVSQKAIELLRAVRYKTFSWVMDLSKIITGTRGDEELRGLLRDTAAICRSTFDVGPVMIRQVLSSEEDIEALLSCAILIHDNTPGKVSSLHAHSRLLLDRDRRLSLTLESVLCDIIRTKDGDRGIDRAVSSVWSSYRSGSKWTPLPESNSPWIWCKTLPTLGQCSQAVYFNLRDGSLLVDGTPMGRLPSEIMRHPLYSHIFGKQVLDVVPADLAGMDYSTRGDVVPGHQIFFSLRNEDLVIRAKQLADIDTVILELIPPEKLAGDLPSVLLDEHVHWLNLSTSALEIRPFDKLWESSLENWSIDCTLGQYRMRKGHEFLIDIRSPSWTMVSNLLEPLDSPQNLLVTACPVIPTRPFSSLKLIVALPRYGLSFYVDKDENLRSHNIRDMVYDEDQSIGTMFGLANRLVLRPKNKNAIAVDLVPRCVLIPEGSISFQKDDHHVRVEIDTQGPAHQRVTYQTYRVDTDLGCLTGNVSLTNKLYCAYLHALTSGCGMDPLTGRSGTEEALSLLRSANCWSIMKFSTRDEELLTLIASLCPSRTWYPEQLRCMQKVEWHDLPASSQHPDLYVVAKGIKEHCEKVSLFQEGQSSALFETFPVQDEHLLKRGALRAAHLLPSDSFGLSYGASFDVRYSGRDLVESTSGEHRAYTAATTVHDGATDATAAKYVENMMETWKDTVSAAAPWSLQYDRSWLHPNLPLIWLEAYNLLRASDDSDEEKWMRLLFSLPAMAYASPELSDVVAVFVTFAITSRFSFEDPPLHASYDLSHGYYPSPDTLSSYVSSSAYPFEDSPESTEPARLSENPNKLRKRQLKMYNERRDADADAAVDEFLSNWPCETPPECSLDPDLYDIEKLMADVETLFSSCYRNLEFRVHLARIQNLLSDAYPQMDPRLDPPYSFQPSESLSRRVAWSVTVDQLFTRPTPSLKIQDQKLPRYIMKAGSTSSSGSTSLQQLITAAAADAINPFHHEYFGALRRSAEGFLDEKAQTVQGTMKQPTTERLVVHYSWCRTQYMKALDYLKQDLCPRSKSERALELSNQWPRITAHALFRLLASNSPVALSDGWKKCLVKLALLALELQRARRLLRLHLDGFQEEFYREAENEGCIGWSAEEHPDWLLIQLQSNFLVRDVQVDVANEMISPSTGKNTATQLNMGEGKSSVIVPISAAVLADGEQVVRVIVPKALTAQMFQLLVDRLGGLANRRIYYVPFSRSVELNSDQVDALQKLMTECMVNRGILVVQPEHVLSLKLMTVEKQLPVSVAEDEQVPGRLLDLQRWLHSHSRDILDESDEILHVRYQLVYTIGLQQPMEGFPDRWTTTQQILDLVNRRASSLQKEFPFGVEYERGPLGSFPYLRILRPDAGKKLILQIAQDVMNGCLPNLNFQHFRPVIKDAIRSFISREEIPPTKARLIKDHCQPTPLWNGLLLLRGLLSTGILLFAFTERRWRVDYGLTSTRTMLAVPYRAKDVPAQRAEFGHPDVSIILTCLSYYYGGLDETQLKASFEVLLKQDDPSVDYDRWVRECSSVPESLRSLGGINIKSSAQWTNYLTPLFSRNKATVDFYLSRVVFPREAKEFPSKLSCSGWDLAEERERLLTGFSGTNDNQYLLPLHITQHDPIHQRGTNAKVLAYLLQPENNHYMCATQKNGERLRTVEFLAKLVAQKPEIRVLLDVGAQMLDLENDEFAEEWLSVSQSSSAAIYFNKDDELTVLTREGNKQLLLSSPFAQQLDQCVIYLDDAHTRGTDINFPSGFRAAVTLGPKVTKDRLVQGCMRMRKLGHGHSIMFFAPLEVDRRIRYVTGKNPSSAISTMDILHWAIRETCDDIQQRAPHWAQQGMDHASRHDVWSSFSRGELTPQELSQKWLQPEAKRLQDLYEPRDPSSVAFQATGDIRRRCARLGALDPRRLLSMDEEQEREVVHEAERERQVDRPPKVPPATHSLHQDVVSFVKTGIVPAKSKAFRPAFETLNATSAATKEAHVWSPSVLVTMDFEKTVNSSKKVDDYLRPVQFIVSGKRAQSDVLVILSPFEADRLIPVLRSSRDVRLHLYTPRVTKSMKSCDDLGLYSIPKVPSGWVPSTPLMDQLNVFAGQLYLRDYETYIRLCRFLCVYVESGDQNGPASEVRSDGFLSPKSRPRHLHIALTFQESPLDALKNLVGLRRKGAHFAPTHMGKLLERRGLLESDFDDISEDNARMH